LKKGAMVFENNFYEPKFFYLPPTICCPYTKKRPILAFLSFHIDRFSPQLVLREVPNIHLQETKKIN